jgi:integrase
VACRILGRRCREQRPFDSWARIRSVTERLGPSFGPMVVFAAATGLRPAELFALEQGDVDRAAGVVQVRRAYANGRVKQTKTRLSRCAVPLKAIALEALDQLQSRQNSPLLFLRAGVPVFALSRFMGTSIAMIDLHYVHLAATSTPSRSWMRSRSSGPWTLGGRRPLDRRDRTDRYRACAPPGTRRPHGLPRL